MSIKLETISINGVDYVRADSVPSQPPQPAGKRAVVVVDRGWVFAGDVERVDGRIKLTRAVHVRSWSNVGFDGMVAAGKSSSVTLKDLPNGVDLPADAELFCVPVSDSWGL